VQLPGFLLHPQDPADAREVEAVGGQGADLGQPVDVVPGVTAVMAYVLFGEKLDSIAIAGMLACAAAVFLVNRRA